MVIKLINRGTSGELLLQGRLDTPAAAETDAIFEQTAERFERVVLNLEGLDYITSSGLRILKKLHVTMKKKGGELVLKNTNRMVMEVFEMTGFVSLLKFE